VSGTGTRWPITTASCGQGITFVSKRVGNFEYHPEWGVLLDQLWVK